MALSFNGTTIPSDGTITFNGVSLTEVIMDNVLVWKKKITRTNPAMSRYSISGTDSGWNNEGYTSKVSGTVSNNTMTVTEEYCSGFGVTMEGRTNETFDLRGFTTATITFTTPKCSGSGKRSGTGVTVGFVGGNSVTYSFTENNDTVTKTINVSALTSAKFYANMYIGYNRNYVAAGVTYTLAIKSIVLT